MALQFPNAKFRGPNVVQDTADYRDDLNYSAIVMAYGGASTQKAFTTTQGQAIPAMKGSSITLAAVHHLSHTELTTNLTKAGEFGSALGDAKIRAIGIDIEPAPVLLATGAFDTYGASPQDVAEILNKTYFQLKVGGKIQRQGPTRMFPALSGLNVQAFTNLTNAIVSGYAANGNNSGGFKLRIPIDVDRTDPIEGVFGVAGSQTLAFATTSGAGSETLVWAMLPSIVRSDVR